MAARKAKIETPGSNVSEVRAKAAIVEIDSKSKGAVLIHLMQVITQQIAYLMTAITNQNTDNNSVRHNNGNGKIPNAKTQRPEKYGKDRICWGCGGIGYGWGDVQHLDKTIISLLNQSPPVLSQHQPGRSQHQWITRESWGAYGTEVPSSQSMG